jgi:hypothetical protein
MEKSALRQLPLSATERVLCRWACSILERLGLPLSASPEDICRALGVTPAQAGEEAARLRVLLGMK